MRLEEVDTPALLIDLDAFERNLRRKWPKPYRRMAESAAPTCQDPQIADHRPNSRSRSVRSASAARKVGEAEILVQGGIKDVFRVE